MSAVSMRWPPPLRVRLSIIAVVLVGAGLLVAGVATRLELRSFLLDRTDRQIRSSAPPVLGYLIRGDTDPGAREQVLGVLPPGSYAALVSADGTIVRSLRVGTGVPGSALAERAVEASVGASSAAGYRIVVITSGGTGPPLSPGAKLVIAMPLSDVNSTLNQLVLLEVVVGLAVLAGVAALAYFLVRRELRPLERIEGTAAAIAAGDLSQRVDGENDSTEVGSLARSLNAMLEQIEAAFEERRRSEEQLRRFVGDASHELRTPLTAVRGFAELFRHGAATRPADLALAMDRIESEGSRMSVLVDDLLLLANLDQGRPLELGPVDLEKLLGEMVSDHALLYPGWPISLAVEGDGEVRGDELRVGQAVANLLSNVRAHTSEGTDVAVRLRTEGPDRLIDVEDSGPGIPGEHLEHVFDRFFRVDPSRARASGGSGLGLSITAAIAAAHGGRAEAFPREGGGTTFRIALPVDGPVIPDGE
ncbi:MAG TPA: HAMP domain-containing sensor histidine kinase [Gaiellales bacterium]|nr:HAMP domain-containing sensor histidine kinase [Gaiellales bacterium]